MRILLKGGTILTAGGFERRDIMIDRGRVIYIFPLREGVSDPVFPSNPTDCSGQAIISDSSNVSGSEDTKYHKDFNGRVIHCDNSFLIPGMTDVHVHLRQPGQGYKETIKTGSAAAAAGGYTTVCTMPNVFPPPQDMESLKKQLDIIKKDAAINVIPYGRISRGTGLSKMEEMKDHVAAYSDDGKGVRSYELMEAAMKEAKRLNRIIASHCEDENFSRGDPGAEWTQVRRDAELCLKTGCRYHVCHVSTAKSVEIVRQAKKAGADISCEVTPHHLLLTEEDVCDEGRFRMEPPLRSAKDREALIEGILDGTIEIIATDHAPHSFKEKAGGMAGSLPGVSGIETAFPVLYTGLVLPGIVTLERLVKMMTEAPCKRFRSEDKKSPYIKEGMLADLAVLDAKTPHIISSEKFISKGKSTPFEGMEVRGVNVMTFLDGNLVFEAEEKKKNETAGL